MTWGLGLTSNSHRLVYRPEIWNIISLYFEQLVALLPSVYYFYSSFQSYVILTEVGEVNLLPKRKAASLNFLAKKEDR